jgi:hypothetical protein
VGIFFDFYGSLQALVLDVGFTRMVGSKEVCGSVVRVP